MLQAITMIPPCLSLLLPEEKPTATAVTKRASVISYYESLCGFVFEEK